MLGEVIGQGKGRRSGRRVVETDPRLRVEVSFEEQVTLLGLVGLNLGSYVAATRPDGTLQGEGEGVFATPEGEQATWKGVGNGRYLAGGAVSYRGALAFSSTSPTLSRLNGIAGVFEFEVDAQGNTSSTIWAWS